MTTKKKLFAPLIRVSTEQMERRGESLRTQREQLARAIEALGGEAYRWYEGQEHATPEHERKILEQLIQDAQAQRFDAVIVADISRWSRDNAKSKQYTKILQESGIRFFSGTMEIDLFIPEHSLILGMGVEMQEFFAKQQKFKSIINRINRAKRGLPSCGKKPWGRIWDKAANTWRVDPEKQAKIAQIARLYLETDISFNELGPKFGMNGANLHKVLLHRCGDKWEVRFRAAEFNIDETHTLTIPRLLPEETIQAIRRKSEARNSYDKRGQKHRYLFARVIYDADSGKALTGTCNRLGQRYYKPYCGCTNRYSINADVLEKAVLDDLFLALGSRQTLQERVFDGHPMGNVADRIRDDLDARREELAQVERRLESYATAIGTAADVAGFMARIRGKLVELEARSEALKDEIAALEYRLATLPTDDEIETWRDALKNLFSHEFTRLQTGATFHHLPWEAQKRLVRMIFGGKDEAGRRYGVYVKDLGGSPRQFRFEAYGKLGNFTGWLRPRTRASGSDTDESLFFGEIPGELAEGVTNLLVENRDDKDYLVNKCHAHHRQRFH